MSNVSNRSWMLGIISQSQQEVAVWLMGIHQDRIMDPENKTVQLAGQAATLSGELYALQERCKHDSTTKEISDIADELARLSTALWTLSDTMRTSPDDYNDAFNEDLAEITTELASVFEEVSDCCKDLQSADSTTSPVPWFFKQGRVSRLVKHLDALKGTLMIMRIVLIHGKLYGTHTSNRLAESSPHTMYEDRVILESLLARNREAILDMHKLMDAVTVRTMNNRPQSPEKAGKHYRELSTSTGVDVPLIPDVLPPAEARKHDDTPNAMPANLSRTFTKRGARLGVHMSIMDAGAHTAPHKLKEKWLQKAYCGRSLTQTTQNVHGMFVERRGLDQISEADTVARSNTNLSKSSHADSIRINESDILAPVKTSNLSFNAPSIKTTGAVCEQTGSTVVHHIRKVLSRLSMSNLRASRDVQRSDSKTSIDSDTDNKQPDGSHHDRHKIASAIPLQASGQSKVDGAE